MRKFLFTIIGAALSVIIACTENDFSNDTKSSQGNAKTESTIRSLDEALVIAQSAIEMVDNSSRTRSGSRRKINLSDTKVCKADAQLRTRSDVGDTLIYVFNFEDNEGFALVSASKETDGLLAVTESGNYNPDVSSSIEGFNQFVENAKKYVANSKASKKETNRSEVPYYMEYTDTLIESVGPYVTVNWGQTYPEGEFCPNGFAGCTITAMAQIMSYFSYPSSISLTYPNADISTQTLNWSQMKSHQTGHNLANCQVSDTTTHKAIGRLMRQLGKLANSQYYSNYTKTYDSYAEYAIQGLGFQQQLSTAVTTGLVKARLDYQQLLLITGAESNDDGHSWVLDGYRYITVTTYCFAQIGIGTDDWILDTIRTTHTYLYHFNWGWYGECNGYFNSAVYYNPTSAYSYDITGAGGHNHTLSIGSAIIVWLN